MCGGLVNNKMGQIGVRHISENVTIRRVRFPYENSFYTYAKIIMHTMNCNDDFGCTVFECTKMKQIVKHYKSCNHQNTYRHVLKCDDDMCVFFGCAKMKELVKETSTIRKQRCRKCSTLITVLVYHASVCRNDICPMYNCSTFKHQLKILHKTAAHKRSFLKLKAVHQFPIPHVERLQWLNKLAWQK